MQKGISFVGLMDIGTLDALKKQVGKQIISTPSLVETSKITTEKEVVKVNESASHSPLSTRLDIQPC